MNKIKLRVVSLCSGVGMQERGMENSPCFEPDVVATSEINIDAIISYAAIHNGLTNEMIQTYNSYPSVDQMKKDLIRMNVGYSPEKLKPYNWNRGGYKFEEIIKKTWLACKLNKNLGDVKGIESLPEADLWFLSMPCTDISVAGKLKGLNPDDNTRSSLIWQTIRLLEKAKEDSTLPKFMVLENVKNLVGKKFINDFEKLNELIGEFGYNVYWQVINAKDTGVPQNRERVFVMYIRKDIDTGLFTFPLPFDTGIRLMDVLEDEVPDNAYINTDKADTLIQNLIDEGKIPADPEEYLKEVDRRYSLSKRLRKERL